MLFKSHGKSCLKAMEKAVYKLLILDGPASILWLLGIPPKYRTQLTKKFVGEKFVEVGRTITYLNRSFPLS
jgi:hypothetical protein